MTTAKSNNARRYLPLAAILLTILLTGEGVAGSEDGAPASTGSWPIRISYSVDQLLGEETVHSEYVLEALGWTAWRQVQTCCDPETGFIVEFRPDGSYWSGGLPNLPLAEGFTHDGDDGMVPLPDLAPRYPSKADELALEPFVEVLADLETGVGADGVRSEVLSEGERLGLGAVDLVVYRVDRQVEVDGTMKAATDVRWVYKPLNLTIRNEQFLDEKTQRLFRVDSVEFLPSS